MKLRKLEILGFKSFKDRTLIDFSNGISAVVGPNGCGKSNIVDAIRWVMGEQRVTSLRGKKMEDVIFNGSDDALPIGMAEVSLTLENGSHQFEGKYSGLEEITVSRRIFREGETEYYINKAPCRLLDIKELFMDAGVGARTYSIVEQERISRLIEAKPEERRQFIEEAAGIMKYKSRKDSALRKMEATKSNITRLNDIISEVKTQLNSTGRQAKKAERFKALKKNIKESRLTLSLQIYSRFVSEAAALKEKYGVLESRCIEAETHLKSREAAVENVKVEIAEAESAVARLQEGFYRIKNDIGIKEQGIAFSKETISDLITKKKNSVSEIVSLRNRREGMGEEIQELERELAETKEIISHLKESILNNQEMVYSLKSTEETLNTELDEEKSGHIDLISENARVKNLLLSMEKGVRDLQDKIEREAKDLEEDVVKRDSLKGKVTSMKAALAREIEENASQKEGEQLLSEKLESEKIFLKAVEKRVEDLKEEMGRKSSRLISLKELYQSLEWCGEGTRAIMGALKKGLFSKEDMCGLVADYIEVPEEYEIAVEAVLGEKLQYIIVKSQREGIKAIDYLREHSSGRSNFVPLEMEGDHSQWECRGRIRVIDLVRIKSEAVEGIIQYLLGDVFLVAHLDEGTCLWNEHRKKGTYVTPEGDIVRPDGVLTGGGKAENGSLLRNVREITELQGEVESISLALEGAKEERENRSEVVSRLTEERNDLRSQMHESELNIRGREKDVERLDGEIKWVEKRINVLTYNREMMEREKADAGEKIHRIRKDLASFDTRAEEVNERIARLQERLGEVGFELEAEEEQLTEQKIEMKTLEEKVNAGDGTLKRLIDSLSDIEERIKAVIREADDADGRVAKIKSNIAAEEEGLKSLYEEYETTERELAQKR
jgi:chromosome segregation protein